MAEIAREFLTRYIEGRDAEAFRELVERHQDMVYAACNRVLGNSADAEDVAQNCFLSLARKPEQVRESVAGWLHRAAVHSALNLAKQKRSRRNREVLAMERKTASRSDSWEDVAEAVDEAIDRLPDDLRIPILRYYLERCTQEEIARELEVTHSAVSKRLKRGVEELRSRLARAGVTLTAAALGTLLFTNAAEAAPIALTAALGKMALAGSAATTTAGGTAAAGAAATIGGIGMKTAVATLIGTSLIVGTLVVHSVSGQKQETSAAPTPAPNELSLQYNVTPNTEQPIAKGQRVIWLAGKDPSPTGLKALPDTPENRKAILEEAARSAVASEQQTQFGPIKEVTILDTTGLKDCTLDLDTGKLWDARDKLRDIEQQGWPRSVGVDVAFHRRGLQAYGMVALAAPAEAWDSSWTDLQQTYQKATSAILQVSKRQWRGKPVAVPMSLDGASGAIIPTGAANELLLTHVEGRLPATFLFATREGGIGILQILGFAEDPKGVNIRYKMVQQEQLSTPGSESAGDTTIKRTITEYITAEVEEADDDWLEFLQMNPGWEFKIGQIYVGQEAALVTNGTEVDADHNRRGFLVFTLTCSDDLWKVTDVDMETQEGLEKEIERFKRQHPDAEAISKPAENTLPSLEDAAKRLGLTLPIEVTKVNLIEDGGTLHVDLIDANKKTYSIYRDCRMVMGPTTTEPPPRHIFTGAYPEKEGSVKHPIGGQVERAIYVLLKDWSQRQADADKRAALLARRGTITGLGKKDRALMRLLGMVQGREKYVQGSMISPPEVPWGEAVDGLQCRLLPLEQIVEVPVGAKSDDIGVYVTFELRNVGDTARKFLPWNTPLEGEQNAPVDVIGPDGKPVRFMGLMALYKRAGGPNAAMTLLPGQTSSKRIRLRYDFTKIGAYTVVLPANRWEKNALRYYYLNDDDKIKTNPDNVWTGTLASNTVTVNVVRPGATPTEEAAWSPVVDGLQCRLLPLEQTVEAPEGAKPDDVAVYMTFELRNAGDMTRKLLPWNTPLEGEQNAPVDVIGPDGKPARFVGPMALYDRAGGPNAAMTLAPGQTSSKRIRLRYDFTKIGAYAVVLPANRWHKTPLRVYYGSIDADKIKTNPDNVWTGALASNTVTITVVRPGAAEKALPGSKLTIAEVMQDKRFAFAVVCEAKEDAALKRMTELVGGMYEQKFTVLETLVSSPPSSLVWGPESGEIRCSIQATETTIQPGAPVVLNCRVQNVGNTPAKLYLKRITHLWRAEITGPDVLKKVLPPGPGPVTDWGFLELKPGETNSFQWSLAEGNGINSWSLSAPGVYRVTLVYHAEQKQLDKFKPYGLNPNDKWMGEFRSNPVTIAVQEVVDTGAVLAPNLESVDLGAVTSALPTGWQISESISVPAPHGYPSDGKNGVKIVFTGPQYVKAPEGIKIGTGQESFTLWIMPADYAPRSNQIRSPTQTSAIFLGSSAEHKVFYLVATASVPTWPNWQKDVAVVFRLDKEEAKAFAVEIVRSYIEGNGEPSFPIAEKIIALDNGEILSKQEFKEAWPEFCRVAFKRKVTQEEYLDSANLKALSPKETELLDDEHLAKVYHPQEGDYVIDGSRMKEGVENFIGYDKAFIFIVRKVNGAWTLVAIGG